MIAFGAIHLATSLTFTSQNPQTEKAKEIHHCLINRNSTHLAIVSREQSNQGKDEQAGGNDPQGSWTHQAASMLSSGYQAKALCQHPNATDQQDDSNDKRQSGSFLVGNE
jgi:hypothetical protein